MLPPCAANGAARGDQGKLGKGNISYSCGTADLAVTFDNSLTNVDLPNLSGSVATGQTFEAGIISATCQ